MVSSHRTRRSRWRSRALASLGALALSATACAHELRPAIATLAIEGRALEVELSLNLEAAIAGIGAGHDDTAKSPAAPEYDRLRALESAALEARFAEFADTLLDGIVLTLDDDRATLRVIGVSIPEVGDPTLARISEVLLAGAIPAGTEALAWQLDGRLGDSVIRIRAAGDGEVLHAAFARAGERAGPFVLGDITPEPLGALLLDYGRLGFVHIVPRGLDHIAFVIGLFLLSTRIASLLWQVSAFTVAHTVTLALGVTGIVNLPAAIVEPLIAASIVYVAVENVLTDRLHRWRPAVVFAFGLLHGLGFAGVLAEIGLPPGQLVAALLAFNVGVELGQIAVLALCFVAVGWAARREWYRRAVAIPGSIAVGGAGVLWLAQRVGVG